MTWPSNMNEDECHGRAVALNGCPRGTRPPEMGSQNLAALNSGLIVM